MTPVEEIRRAAQLMRERAQAAKYQDDRWSVDVVGPVASTSWLGPTHDVLTATWPQATHVALWSPDRVGDVADLLDAIATYDDEFNVALAVVRAYLGGAT